MSKKKKVENNSISEETYTYSLNLLKNTLNIIYRDYIMNNKKILFELENEQIKLKNEQIKLKNESPEMLIEKLKLENEKLKLENEKLKLENEYKSN